MLLVGPDTAKASVGTLGDTDSGLPLTPTCCLPEALPTAALLETVSTNNHVDVVMAPAAPLGDARPSLARPVSGPDVTIVAPDSSLNVPLVERYQSTTPSPTPTAPETMEEHLVRLLGLQITASLAPIQSSVANIGIRLRAVEDGAAWGGDDNASLGIGGYDKGYGYDIPAELPPGGEEHVDYHIESTPSHAAAEDAEMADAHRRFESHDDNEDPHPYFEMVIMATRNQPHNEIDPTHLSTLTDIASEDWEDFCSIISADRRCIPLSSVVNDAFIHRTCIWLVKAQIEDDLKHALCLERGSPAPPASPLLTGPHLRPDDPSDSVPTRLSEPISVSLAGTKISGFTESSLTPTPCARPAGSALDLDTPPPGDGVGWSVMGGKHGRSFASITAARPPAPPTPPALPPSLMAATHGFLTKPQLDSLTHEQVINAFNAWFSPKLSLCVPKDRVVAAFLDKASRPAPGPTLAPRPITKTEFTLVYDTRAGDLLAPSGRRGDTASFVRTIQKHIKDAGTKQAKLIGG